jgi:hypothetical protein
MKTRTIEEIERVFREIGLTEATWGKQTVPKAERQPSSAPQIFVRIETTTTPLGRKTDADLA